MNGLWVIIFRRQVRVVFESRSIIYKNIYIDALLYKTTLIRI